MATSWPSIAVTQDGGTTTTGAQRRCEPSGIASDRNKYQLACVGKCGNPGDEGGHLIAASLGGAGDRINIVPQASTLNRGEWKAMEAMLNNEIDAGKKVLARPPR